MPAFVTQTAEFLTEVRTELRRVVWPNRKELKSYTIGILIFVLLIAGFIALVDLILQAILVKGIPALFGK